MQRPQKGKEDSPRVKWALHCVLAELCIQNRLVSCSSGELVLEYRAPLLGLIRMPEQLTEHCRKTLVNLLLGFSLQQSSLLSTRASTTSLGTVEIQANLYLKGLPFLR